MARPYLSKEPDSGRTAVAFLPPNSLLLVPRCSFLVFVRPLLAARVVGYPVQLHSKRMSLSSFKSGQSYLRGFFHLGTGTSSHL